LLESATNGQTVVGLNQFEIWNFINHFKNKMATRAAYNDNNIILAYETNGRCLVSVWNRNND